MTADLKAQIAGELHQAPERLDADLEFLAIVSSWRDTLRDQDFLREGIAPAAVVAQPRLGICSGS
jgi:hypothetical protein